MTREIFDAEHEAFRDAAGTFLDKEVVPFHQQWEKDGIVDREVWAKAGAQGLLGLQLDEEYGGGGTPDFRYNVVIGEEMTRRGVYGAAFPLFNDMIVPYLVASANEEQRKRWFPDLASGEKIAAIAMTEPGAGSDLQSITTTAIKDGNGYRLSGAKTFISSGQLANLIIVVAKTDPKEGAKGISLMVLETEGAEGFRRGKKLDKIGQDASDTSELFFDDVYLPSDSVLGGVEGRGFYQLMGELPQERLVIAIGAMTTIEKALDTTVEYVKQRKAFGKTIWDFQNTQFVLADLKAKATAAKVFVNDCIAKVLKGELDVTTASIAKYWCTELQGEVVDKCLQFHGGWGYINEYAIAKMYRDSRITRIFGGSNEIMKMLIARSM